MFDYSVAPKPNPRDREAAPKYYAMAQCRGNVNLNQFAKQLSAGCGNFFRQSVIIETPLSKPQITVKGVDQYLE